MSRQRDTGTTERERGEVRERRSNAAPAALQIDPLVLADPRLAYSANLGRRAQVLQVAQGALGNRAVQQLLRKKVGIDRPGPKDDKIPGCAIDAGLPSLGPQVRRREEKGPVSAGSSVKSAAAPLRRGVEPPAGRGTVHEEGERGETGPAGGLMTPHDLQFGPGVYGWSAMVGEQLPDDAPAVAANDASPHGSAVRTQVRGLGHRRNAAGFEHSPIPAPVPSVQGRVAAIQRSCVPQKKTSGFAKFFESRARQKGKGWHSGGGLSTWCDGVLKNASAHFEKTGRPDLARGTEVFRRLLPLEGTISAVNTWDSQLFTWGAGFAHGGMLPYFYRALDPAVKGFLSSNAPGRFTPTGVTNMNECMRKDTHALGVVVRASEHPSYKRSVLRAQLRTFLVKTVGFPTSGGPGPRILSEAGVKVNTLSVHLSHWLPKVFVYPTDLETAMSAAGGAKVDPSLQVAAVFRVFVDNLIHRGFGRCLPKRGYCELSKQGLKYDPIGHFRRNLRKIFGTFKLDPVATQMLPSFTSGSSGYFSTRNRLKVQGEMAASPGMRMLVQTGRPATCFDFGVALTAP